MPAGHFNQYQMHGHQQQQPQQPNENNWNYQQQPPAPPMNTSVPNASNVQQIPPPQQFNAANVFDNANTDGWGDWGDNDWNDNAQNHLQQQQHNFGVNQFTANNIPPPQPLYGQATQYQQQQQPPHPFQSQQNSDHSQYGNPTPHMANIADSFGDNSNWNWNASESVAGPVDPSFRTVGKEAALKHSRNTSNASDSTPTLAEKTENNLPRPPDNNKNTQLNNPAMSRIIKSERLLTPQWSTESQMSHTSSDRSIDSDALNSRSTTSSDDPSHHQQHYPYHETNQQSLSNYGMENESSHYHHKDNNAEANTVDKLDEVLFALNVDRQATESSTNSYESHSNVIQHPPSLINQQQANEWNPVQNAPPINYPTETIQQPIRPTSASSLPPPPAFQEYSRTTPSPMNNHPPIASSPMNLPPPPTMHQMVRKNSSPLNQPQPQPTPPAINQPPNAFSSEHMTLPPPPMQQPQRKNSSPLNQVVPPPSSTSSGAENPFKRTGAHAHNKNIFHSESTASPAVTTLPTQLNQFTPNEFNQQQPPPDNSEVIDQTPNRNFVSNENHELAPHNDRNQYLQTGHLSEEAFLPDDRQSMNVEYQNDNLPPPGLSRLVLGEPEVENHQTHPTEPPPGLDRMIPGTDLTNSTPLNLDRQADGQDTMSQVSAMRAPVSVPNYPIQHQQQQAHPSSQQQHHSSVPVNLLDRNSYLLYSVPGESDMHTQRVVTGGLEREGSRSAQDVSVNPLADEERELVMDGENLEDNNIQDNSPLSREDPIEGANTGDETHAATANAAENEQIITPVDVTKKFNSNPSTCNDDSDKERSSYYRTRRGDDGSRRRRDKNAERYETEDTDYSDRERGRFNREGSARNERSRRSKDKDDWPKESRERYRDDRERNRKEGDRYRGEKGRSDRYARYETDGSRYETEDSRYERYRRDDRDGRDRREDGGRRQRRAEQDRSERNDRGDRSGRSDRHTDGRSKRYKDPNDSRREKPSRPADSYYDYEDDHYRRTGSRTGDRGEKDARYATPNYYQQGYGYDQYSYYQQQQYYETMRRTNPKAYAEWYKMYYSQMQQAQLSGSGAPTATDGRDSVHSGRSSANEKER